MDQYAKDQRTKLGHEELGVIVGRRLSGWHVGDLSLSLWRCNDGCTFRQTAKTGLVPRPQVVSLSWYASMRYFLITAW